MRITRDLLQLLTLLVMITSCKQVDDANKNQVGDTVKASSADALYSNNSAVKSATNNNQVADIIKTLSADTLYSNNSNIKSLTKFRADSFVQSILNTNAQYWTFRPDNETVPKYIKSFKQAGLKIIHAYSDRSYPQKSKPSLYNHYVLFLLEYQDEKSAISAFKTFAIDAESFAIDKEQVEGKDYERIRLIHGFSKYGGLVGQKDNLVMTLVETCGYLHKFRSWADYEKNFIESIYTVVDSSSIILNSDCGNMKYVKQRIGQFLPSRE